MKLLFNCNISCLCYTPLSTFEGLLQKKKKYISQYINTGTFPFIVNIGIATKNHDWSGSNNNFCSNTSYKQEELFLRQQYLSQLGVDE